MTRGLTPHMDAVLTVLRQSDHTPSYRQMQKLTGIKSMSTLVRSLDSLEARGFVERLPNRARAVRVLAAPKAWNAPDLSTVSTGDLIAALAARGIGAAHTPPSSPCFRCGARGWCAHRTART